MIEPMADCVEIFSEGLHDLFREEELAFSYDLKYTVHAPSTDMNLSSLREPIRLAAISLVEEMADMCNELDSDVLVVHPGYYSYPVDMMYAQRSFERSLVDLEGISKDTGVRMCIENMPKWDCFCSGIRILILRIMVLLWILGMRTHGGTLIISWKWGDSISHFHLHDNNGEIDDHFFIGGGNIDFPSFSGLLNKSKAIKIIENKCEEDVLKSLEALK
ncbi:sugar phosphate isomerase/epimerase family protein [Methanococcoides alaskense]|uniref:Sugar phosphate isomerase/epimerase n=1 Tax=Methanococcoides alaskense TaxID=325778 RepID=A0AA90ZB83_9EURY|nr:sugar phosphate isomerase/epimerase family protein [Methanococcoides alaskense]MDA0525088.1 sugar phosphate isomerase/epimerase [Methanococcoides alaskense]MDR6221992.1 sugar phosphate isomerase/epimerase [Methanococcoides alaskense]